MTGARLPFFKDLGRLNLGGTKLFRIILMLTSRCPLRCTHCGIWKSRPGTDLALADLETFFMANRFSWINLTGGEIFLRHDMAELFQLLARSQPDLAFLSFPTSGFLKEKTLEGVEAALQAGLSGMMVTVSFDGGRKAHDTLRGVEGSFDRAAETFRALKSLAGRAGGRLQILPGITLSRELLEHSIDPVEDLMIDLNLESAKEVHVNLAHQAAHYYGDTELAPLPPEEMGRLLKGLIRKRGFPATRLDWLEKVYLKGALRFLSTGESPLACKACQASLFIDAEWTAYPCTIYPRALGSLRDFDFKLAKLTASPAFREAREAVAAKDCPGCWTPCEAYTAMVGNLFSPSLYKLALGREDGP